MGSLFTLIVVAAVVAWLVKRSRAGSEDIVPLPRPGASVFRVVFRDGRVTKTEGRIPRNTLHAFEDIAAHADLDGEVSLSGDGDLRFSDAIPAGVRQQLRNAHLASAHVH